MQMLKMFCPVGSLFFKTLTSIQCHFSVYTPTNIDCITFIFTPVGSAVKFSLDEVFIHIIIVIITRIHTTKQRDIFFFFKTSPSIRYLFSAYTSANIDYMTFIFTPVCSVINSSLDEVFIHIIITIITHTLRHQTAKGLKIYHPSLPNSLSVRGGFNAPPPPRTKLHYDFPIPWFKMNRKIMFQRKTLICTI